MLKQRIITALLMLPIALGGFFLLEGGAFALFIGAVISVAAWEWAQLAGLQGQPQRLGYAALVAVLLLLLFSNQQLAGLLMALAMLWWLLATALVLTFPSSARHWAGSPVRLVIGLLLLLPAWQGLLLLKQWPHGNALILAVMIMVWGADIGAYFAGRAFGKRKLAPEVSPGKSWEGVFGGLLATAAIALGVSIYLQWSPRIMVLALLATLLVVSISVVGDLTESMFKRHAGIKDSSNLLPGHGGVLDRIDSLTAAVPLFTVLLWLFGWGIQ
jgi:phosphatidate cytidylyltransferase